MKRTMIYLFVIWAIGGSFLDCMAQQTIVGKVVGENKESLIGVNIQLHSNNSGIGTISNLDGLFSLEVENLNDSIFFSYIGYQNRTIQAKDLMTENIVRLKAQTKMLEMAEVSASKALASEFSVSKLDKVDIYLNPSASADPLKALTIYPYSTNLDETANPVLRGSNPSFSSVQINGVPINNPVKANTMNGIGFFSIFHPEIIGEMTVYPSNPPIYMGQSIGGAVEITTNQKAQKQHTDLSLSLASMGFFHTQNIADGNSYVQVYSNYQFSDAFQALNNDRNQQINHFQTLDIGLNTYIKINSEQKLSYLAYGIQEKNNVNLGFYNYSGQAKSEAIRNFHVLSHHFKEGNSLWKTSYGFDYKKDHIYIADFSDQKNTRQDHFLRTELTQTLWSVFILQFGLNYQYNHLQDEDLHTESFNLERKMENVEGYLFFQYGMKNWTWSGGLRLGNDFSKKGYINYQSFQINTKYELSPRSKFILSAGQYEKLLLQDKTNLLKSTQIASEYILEDNKKKIQIALYYKKENYENPIRTIDNIGVEALKNKLIFGGEIFVHYDINKHWSIGLSNTFIQTRNQENIILNPSTYLFLKGNLSYQHAKWGVFSLALIQRPGKYYTPIDQNFVDGVTSNPYSNTSAIHAYQYPNYSSFNFMYSKQLDFKNKEIIIFSSISNLMDRANVESIYYATDFKTTYHNYYQPMTLYFGTTIKI